MEGSQRSEVRDQKSEVARGKASELSVICSRLLGLSELKREYDGTRRLPDNKDSRLRARLRRAREGRGEESEIRDQRSEVGSRKSEISRFAAHRLLPRPNN